MKNILEEDRKKLYKIGLQIEQLKRLNKELIDFFIKDRTSIYETDTETQELLDVIELYIKGKSSDYIGEQVFQSDGTIVKEVLGMFGIIAK